MNKEDKVKALMSRAGARIPVSVSISIDLWIAAENGENDPLFDEWLKACTRITDEEFKRTGKKDRDSVFARYVQMYGRHEG